MSTVHQAAKFPGQTIPAIRLVTTDREAYRPVRTALLLIDEIRTQHPKQFEWGRSIDRLTGSDKVRLAIDGGALPVLLEEWDRETASFRERREPFLRYDQSCSSQPIRVPAGTSAGGRSSCPSCYPCALSREPVMTGTVLRTAAAPAPGAYDRVFYSTIAIALGFTVFAGFASTYYLPLIGIGPRETLSGGPYTRLVHLHGALFTGWVVLFLVQTTLVARRRVALHRKLGAAGGVLALSMVVVGTRTALEAASRGAAPPGVDSLTFLIVPLADMVLFSGFVCAALMRRRDKEAHKRLMLLAYVSILAAATARLPGMLPRGPLVFFGLSLVFVAAGAMYDFATRRRVHRVYVWGGALLAISVPLRLAISGTAAWRALASAITR